MDTIVRAFKDYLQKEKNYSVHTLIAYENDLISFQDFNKVNFDQDSIDGVNYSQIRSWIVFLVDKGLSAVTVNRKMASLKAFYRFLLKTKQIEVSPMLKHKSLKASKSLQIPFSEKEMQLVLKQVYGNDGFSSVRNQAIIELFYATGMRRAELIHLMLKDIDVGQGHVKVLGKRNKERLIPLLPAVMDSLRVYIKFREEITVVDQDFLLLTNKGLKIYETLVYRLINSYFSQTSQKVKKSPHILRHSLLCPLIIYHNIHVEV